MKPYVPIAVAALLFSVYACTHPAKARELSSADLKRIEHINQARNREVYADRWRANQGPCAIYASYKAVDLAFEGYGPDSALAFVIDETGHGHEVVKVYGEVKGVPKVLVLDNRLSWIAEQKDLEAIGYTFLFEFRQGPKP